LRIYLVSPQLARASTSTATRTNNSEGQEYEAAINFSSWDTFFFTRNFPSIDSDRAVRHVSKVLTYPITIASVLHQNGPYTPANSRITREGQRSMAGRSTCSYDHVLMADYQPYTRPSTFLPDPQSSKLTLSPLNPSLLSVYSSWEPEQNPHSPHTSGNKFLTCSPELPSKSTS